MTNRHKINRILKSKPHPWVIKKCPHSKLLLTFLKSLNIKKIVQANSLCFEKFILRRYPYEASKKLLYPPGNYCPHCSDWLWRRCVTYVTSQIQYREHREPKSRLFRWTHVTSTPKKIEWWWILTCLNCALTCATHMIFVDSKDNFGSQESRILSYI